jgi:hypothetical protein
MRLFTQAERIAIRQAAKVNEVVEDYQAILDASPEKVRLSDADIQEGIPELEDAGLLAPGRAAQILSGEPPV